MRGRYRREVSADDVGSRVTVRRWVDDPEEGRVKSDVVGRLVGWEDGVLAIRRRDGDLVEVDADDVVASKVIPAHPRLDPEAYE